MFLKHSSPNEASKLFLHHPSDAGWMLEGWEEGRDFRNAPGSVEPQHFQEFLNVPPVQLGIWHLLLLKLFGGKLESCEWKASGICGYKIDRSREEAPTGSDDAQPTGFSILWLSDLPTPPDQRFFPMSPVQQSQVPWAQSCSPRTMGCFELLEHKFHPRSTAISPPAKSTLHSFECFLLLTENVNFGLQGFAAFLLNFHLFLPWWMLRLLKAPPGNHRDLFPFSFIKTCKIGQGRKNMRTFLSERRNRRPCRGTPRVLLYCSLNKNNIFLSCSGMSFTTPCRFFKYFCSLQELHRIPWTENAFIQNMELKNTVKHHLYDRESLRRYIWYLWKHPK